MVEVEIFLCMPVVVVVVNTIFMSSSSDVYGIINEITIYEKRIFSSIS